MNVDEARRIVTGATTEELESLQIADEGEHYGYLLDGDVLADALATLIQYGREQRVFERAYALAEGKGSEWAESPQPGTKMVGGVVKADVPLLRALAGEEEG